MLQKTCLEAIKVIQGGSLEALLNRVLLRFRTIRRDWPESLEESLSTCVALRKAKNAKQRASYGERFFPANGILTTV